MYYPFQSCRSSRFVTVQSSIRYLTVSPLSLSITFCIPFHFQYTPPTELHHSFYALEFVEWLWKFHESYRLSTFILSITYFISLEGSTPFLSHGVHYLVLVLHNKIKTGFMEIVYLALCKGSISFNSLYCHFVGRYSASCNYERTFKYLFVSIQARSDQRIGTENLPPPFFCRNIKLWTINKMYTISYPKKTLIWSFCEMLKPVHSFTFLFSRERHSILLGLINSTIVMYITRMSTKRQAYFVARSMRSHVFTHWMLLNWKAFSYSITMII